MEHHPPKKMDVISSTGHPRDTSRIARPPVESSQLIGQLRLLCLDLAVRQCGSAVLIPGHTLYTCISCHIIYTYTVLYVFDMFNMFICFFLSDVVWYDLRYHVPLEDLKVRHDPLLRGRTTEGTIIGLIWTTMHSSKREHHNYSHHIIYIILWDHKPPVSHKIIGILYIYI